MTDQQRQDAIDAAWRSAKVAYSLCDCSENAFKLGFITGDGHGFGRALSEFSPRVKPAMTESEIVAETMERR